jgi:hypothetical protein
MSQCLDKQPLVAERILQSFFKLYIALREVVVEGVVVVELYFECGPAKYAESVEKSLAVIESFVF